MFKWLKMAGSLLVGGVVGSVTALTDPEKYQFPRDFGSGHLWKYFFMGAGLMLVGNFLRSPLGQKSMSNYEATLKQLEETEAMLQAAKTKLRENEKGEK